MADPTEEENLGEEEGGEQIEAVKKIFLNRLDSYHGKALAQALSRHEIRGTVRDPSEYDMYSNRCPSEVLDPFALNFRDLVVENEVIIYDIGSEEGEIDEAHKTLEALERIFKRKNAKQRYCKNKEKEEELEQEKNKYFILISTPLTWADTFRKEEKKKDGKGEEEEQSTDGDKEKAEEEEEEEEVILTEDIYRKRRCHRCYIKHQFLEREVVNIQKRCKPYLHTVVICPGCTYGGSNEIFNYIFKLAFHGEEIPLFVKKNSIPMLYIKDFSKMVKQIVTRFPDENLRYILAVQPDHIYMQEFTRNVSWTMTGYINKIKDCTLEDVLEMSEELIPNYVYHSVTMNIKMEPTYFSNFTFLSQETPNLYEVLAQEYRIERHLLPLKIIIDGPPCAGKTALARKIEKFYKLKYLEINEIVYTARSELENIIEQYKESIKILQTQNIDTGTGNEDLQKVQEDFEKTVEVGEKLLDDLAMSIERHPENKEFSFALIKQCLTTTLSLKPICENQGYVIDGFPFTYKQATEIFCPPVEEEEEGFEDETKNIKSKIKPNVVIILDSPDEVLCTRAMAITEDEAIRTRNTEDEMLARLEKYRERNQEDTSLTTFSYDIEVTPISITTEGFQRPEDVFEKAKLEIGPPHTYPLTKKQREELKQKEEQELKAKLEEEARLRIEAANIERAEREEKLRKWTEKFEQMKKAEQEILEAKTLPVRQYLTKYVLPTLTDGIMEVAENKPDDPVDFLAEYLFRCNPTGHILNPVYSHDAKKFLLDDGDKNVVQVFEMLAENENEFGCKRDRHRDSETNSKE